MYVRKASIRQHWTDSSQNKALEGWNTSIYNNFQQFLNRRSKRHSNRHDEANNRYLLFLWDVHSVPRTKTTTKITKKAPIGSVFFFSLLFLPVRTQKGKTKTRYDPLFHKNATTRQQQHYFGVFCHQAAVQIYASRYLNTNNEYAQW